MAKALTLPTKSNTNADKAATIKAAKTMSTDAAPVIVNSLATANPIRERAKAFVAGWDTSLNDALHVMVERDEERAMDCLQFYLLIEEHMTEEQLDAAPIVGSKQTIKREDGTEVQNNNPDKYKFGKDQGSFYDDAWMNTPEGMDVETKKRILLAIKNNSTPDQFASDYQEYFERMKYLKAQSLMKELESELTRLNNRIRYGRDRVIKRAFALRQQLKRIKQELNDPNEIWVDLIKLRDKEGNEVGVTSSTDCFMIGLEKIKGSGEEVSVNDLLAYDVDEAKTKGGTLAALKETVKRPSGTARGQGGKSEPDAKAIKTAEQAWGTINNLLLFFEHEDHVVAFRRSTGPNIKGSEEVIKSIAALKFRMDVEYALVEQRYELLQKKENRTAEEMAAAELAASNKKTA